MKKPAPDPDLEAQQQELQRLTAMNQEDLAREIEGWFKEDPETYKRTLRLFRDILFDDTVH